MYQLTKTDKASYALGQLPWSAKDVCFNFFIFFYYTQVLGLSPSLAGLGALLAIVFDALSDPFVGQLSDNYKSKNWGRRHPFMIAATVPFCLGLVAMFYPPAGLSQAGLFSWFLVVAVVVRTSLSFFSIPFIALGAELSEDYLERTSIMVTRTTFGYGSAILIQVAAWFYFLPRAAAAGDSAAGYQHIAVFSALCSLLAMAACIWATRRHIARLPATSSEQQAIPWHTAIANIVALLKVPAVRILLGGSLIMLGVMGLANTMLIHVNTFFYGFNNQQTGIFMLCVLAALLPSSWLAMQFAGRYGKRGAMVRLNVIVSLLGPVPILLHLGGWIGSSGSALLLTVVGGFVFVHQAFFIAQLGINGSMLPDIVDERELSNGLRQEGMITSAFMLIQKFVFGIAVFLAGVAVEFAGFSGTVDPSQVTEQMLFRLAIVYGPVLALIGLSAALVYHRYPISRVRYAAIRNELEQKRAALL